MVLVLFSSDQPLCLEQHRRNFEEGKAVGGVVPLYMTWQVPPLLWLVSQALQWVRPEVCQVSLYKKYINIRPRSQKIKSINLKSVTWFLVLVLYPCRIKKSLIKFYIKPMCCGLKQNVAWKGDSLWLKIICLPPLFDPANLMLLSQS